MFNCMLYRGMFSADIHQWIGSDALTSLSGEARGTLLQVHFRTLHVYMG